MNALSRLPRVRPLGPQGRCPWKQNHAGLQARACSPGATPQSPSRAAEPVPRFPEQCSVTRGSLSRNLVFW
eukprot:9369025-Pyramimonas_sp.AAC.1